MSRLSAGTLLSEVEPFCGSLRVLENFPFRAVVVSWRIRDPLTGISHSGSVCHQLFDPKKGVARHHPSR